MSEEKIPRAPSMPTITTPATTTPPAPAISFGPPDPNTGVQPISVAPGTTITTKGPPPSAGAVLASLVPDVAAIVTFAAWGWHGTASAQFSQAAIMGVLALRLYASRPGEEAKSAVHKGVELVAAIARGITRRK